METVALELIGRSCCHDGASSSRPMVLLNLQQIFSELPRRHRYLTQLEHRCFHLHTYMQKLAHWNLRGGHYKDKGALNRSLPT